MHVYISYVAWASMHVFACACRDRESLDCSSALFMEAASLGVSWRSLRSLLLLTAMFWESRLHLSRLELQEFQIPVVMTEWHTLLASGPRP